MLGYTRRSKVLTIISPWTSNQGDVLLATPDLLVFLEGEVLFTTPNFLVFPNIATTTIFHVHCQEHTFLTCELFLLERLPSGATMINRWWCYNC